MEGSGVWMPKGFLVSDGAKVFQNPSGKTQPGLPGLIPENPSPIKSLRSRRDRAWSSLAQWKVSLTRDKMSFEVLQPKPFWGSLIP